MAIELGQQVFNNAQNELLKRFGATDEDLSLLRDRLEELKLSRNMDEWELVSGRLARYEAFRKAILSTDNPFLDPLATYFPHDSVEHSFNHIQSQPAITPPAETRPRTRKPDKYIDGASAFFISELIDLKDGELKHKSLKGLGILGLKAEQQAVRSSQEDARLYVYQEAIDTSRGLLSEASKQKARTIRELFSDDFLKKFKNAEWREVYKKMASLYGSLAPQVFVQTVLLRFHPDEVRQKIIPSPVKERKNKRQKAEIEIPKHISEISPKHVTPLDELMLDNRLILPETDERLRIFLEDRMPLEVAVANGFECNEETLGECVQTAREGMAKLRNNIPPSNLEGEASIKNVKRIVRAISKNPKRFKRLGKEFTGFKFIYAISKELGNEEAKVDELLNVLFPNIVYQADGAESFLLKGRSTEI